MNNQRHNQTPATGLRCLDRLVRQSERPRADVPRLVRLTWRKGKRREGMMRLPETYALHRGDEELAICQRLQSGDWFWYGGGMNTADVPTDLETAKRDAKAHILANTEDRHVAKPTQKGNENQ